MTTEEKLELAKDLYQSANDEQKYVIEKLFPELRESGDEIIRKWLIELVEEVRKANPTSADHNGMCSEAIAWLEKQNDAPKFKVGDWIIKNDGKDCFSDCSYVLRITSIDGNKYKLSNHCYLIEPFANTYRLWTIEDAKPGDVIFSNDGHGNDSIELIKSISDNRIEFWFCLSSNNNFKDCYFEVFDGFIPYTNLVSRKGAIPATKEQRDLLFQKMYEAGYEWDEKKEVKNIEQNPDWSKEDEEMLDAIIADIKFTQKAHIHDVNQSVYEREIDWLKSRRP